MIKNRIPLILLLNAAGFVLFFSWFLPANHGFWLSLDAAIFHFFNQGVGKSQAYAWLLTPHPKAMTTDAQKRLEAIASLEDLGAGFALATHDLEIRGAGELLGEDQSGSMETIGFSLYMELLENAVDALKAGREPSLEDLTSQQTEVELRMPSLLPDDFIPDVNTRLSFYKRIASAKKENELEEIKVFRKREKICDLYAGHKYLHLCNEEKAGKGVEQVSGGVGRRTLHFLHHSGRVGVWDETQL